MMIPWELYNSNQIFFGPDDILTTTVVKNPGGSCSVLPDLSIVIPLFLPFPWPLCSSRCCTYVPFTAFVIEEWWEERHSLCYCLASSGLDWMHVVVGQGGEMVFGGEQREGILKPLYALSFLMGSNQKGDQTVWGLRKKNATFLTPSCPLS